MAREAIDFVILPQLDVRLADELEPLPTEHRPGLVILSACRNTRA